MESNLSNWSTQIRKGYLELCALCLLESRGRLYGVELIEALREAGLQIKEGTLYPMLNRMSADGVLKAQWETEGAKGHPRKFYSLTDEGKQRTFAMKQEFEKMNEVIKEFQAKRSEEKWEATKNSKTT